MFAKFAQGVKDQLTKSTKKNSPSQEELSVASQRSDSSSSDDETTASPTKEVTTRRSILGSAKITIADLEKKFPALAELRGAFENADAISRLASALILANPRFIDLQDVPAVFTSWTPETATSNDYNSGITQELGEDEDKIASLMEFIDWQKKYETAVNAEFSLDEALFSWVRRIQALCALNKNVLAHYVNPQDDAYPFSLLPLEQLRYFYHELVTIVQFQAQVQAWMSNIIVQNHDFLKTAEWLYVEEFTKAINHVAATIMTLCVTLLSMKNAFEHDQKLKKSFSVKQKEIVITEVSTEEDSISIEEKIAVLEKNLVELENKVASKKEAIDTIKNSPEKYLASEKLRLQTLADGFEAKILAWQAKSDEELSDEDRENKKIDMPFLKNCFDQTNQTRLYVEHNSEEYCQSQLEAAVNFCEKTTQKVEVQKAELAQKQAQKKAQDAMRLAKAKAASAMQEALKSEEVAWQKDFPVGVKLLAAYAEKQLLKSLIPTSVHYIKDEVAYTLIQSLLEDYPDEKTQTLIKEYVSSSNQSSVAKFTSVGFRLLPGTFDFEMTFRSEEGILSRPIIVSFARCHKNYNFDTVEMVAEQNALPQSVSSAIALAYENKASKTGEEISDETNNVLSQLKETSELEKYETRQEEDNSQEQSTLSRFIQGGNKPKTKLAKKYHGHAMREGDERTLHALIRATESSESVLSKLIDQYEVRYNLQAAPTSPLEIFVTRLWNQALFFKLRQSQNEKSSFSNAQLAHLSKGNLFLQMHCIQEIIAASHNFKDQLLQVRIHSLLKVFEKLSDYSGQLPEWVNLFADQVRFSEKKEAIKQLPSVLKTKLVFGLAIELVCGLLSELSQAKQYKADSDTLRKIVQQFRKIQAQFNLLFGEFLEDLPCLAVSFLAGHADELLQGTNFEVKEVVASLSVTQVAMPQKTKRTSILPDPFKAMTGMLKANGAKNSASKSIAVSENAQEQKQVAFEITEEHVTLFVLPAEKIKQAINTTLPAICEKIHNSSEIEEMVLEQDFSERSMAAIKILPVKEAENNNQDEDEYQEALAQKKRSDEEGKVLATSFASIVLDDEMLANELYQVNSEERMRFHEALNFATNARAMLRNLILNSARFRCAAADFPVNTSARFVEADGVAQWIAEIKEMNEQRHHALSQYDAPFQLSQLHRFETLLIKIAKLDTEIQQKAFFHRQETLVKNEFIVQIKRLAAVTMYLSMIVLAVKEQMDVMQNKKVSTEDGIWNDYFSQVELFQNYVKSLKSFDSIAVSSPIECFLPAVEPRLALVINEPSQVQKMRVDLYFIEEKNKDTKEVTKKLTISLKSDPYQLFSVWHIFQPEQLSPLRAVQFFSPIKIANVYTKKVNKSAFTMVKGVGAMHERAQLTTAGQRSYGPADKLLLIGFYGLLYTTARLNVTGVVKAEELSRIAQSLYEVCLQELGVDLREFFTVYDNALRPQAYESSKHASSSIIIAPRTVLCMQIVFQIALSAFKNQKIALDEKRPNDKIPFYTTFQLEFGSRSNGYQQLLNAFMLIEKYNLLKNADSNNVRILREFLTQLGNIIDALPDHVTSFLKGTGEQTMQGYADKNGLSSAQKIKLALIFEVEFYRVMLTSIGEADAADIFAYIQTSTLLSSVAQNESCVAALATEFNRTQSFFSSAQLNALKAPASFDRNILLESNVATLFQGLKVSAEEEVLISSMTVKKG